MIKPNHKPAIRHKITAYDLEWREEPLRNGGKKLIPTLAGAYDERGYRKYLNCQDFLKGELVPGTAGRRYYAHFGGGADMVFLLKELARLPAEYVVSGVFSGSAAIVVRVVRGDLQWLFLDSFWTLRVRLAKIGEWLGFPQWKGNVKDMTWAELVTYNEIDCKVLHEAMCRTQETILNVGGELGITIASTAMKTFLRKYLKRPIKNSEHLDELARAAYTASRVEVIRSKCQEANYYDINSSFPYSFTHPCPGGQSRNGFFRDRLPPGYPLVGGDAPCPGSAVHTGARRAIPDSPDKLWIAEVDLKVPDDCYLPAVPFHSKGRIFFPKGEFSATITSEDYKASGFNIKKVHSCTVFEDRDDLRAFAEEFFALRQVGGFESEVYKICVNGLYGKWAEREEKTVLLVNPASRNLETQELLAPGIVVQLESKKVAHSHVPMSCIITARSRRLLLEGLRETAELGRVYYADTDSIVCDADMPAEKVGKKLGQWKHEYRIQEGVFVSQKLYAMKLGDNDAEARAKKDGKTFSDLPESEKDFYRRLQKAKGFSRVVGFVPLDGEADDEDALEAKTGHQTDSKPLSYKQFITLTDGRKVKIERMLRIRELLAKDKTVDYQPRSVVMVKGLNRRIDKDTGIPVVRPKRRHLPDGDSEPWDAKELVDWVRGADGVMRQFRREPT